MTFLHVEVIYSYPFCRLSGNIEDDSNIEKSLRDAVSFFTRALTELFVEKKNVTLSQSENNLLKSDEKNDNDEECTSLSINEMEEYATLALAYCNLRLKNWAVVQSTLSRFLQSATINDHVK